MLTRFFCFIHPYLDCFIDGTFTTLKRLFNLPFFTSLKQGPSLLNHNNSVVKRGLERQLSYTRVSFRVYVKNREKKKSLLLSTKILSKSLSSLNLIGFFYIFSSCFNLWWWSKTLHPIMVTPILLLVSDLSFERVSKKFIFPHFVDNTTLYHFLFYLTTPECSWPFHSLADLVDKWPILVSDNPSLPRTYNLCSTKVWTIYFKKSEGILKIEWMKIFLNFIDCYLILLTDSKYWNENVYMKYENVWRS